MGPSPGLSTCQSSAPLRVSASVPVHCVVRVSLPGVDACYVSALFVYLCYASVSVFINVSASALVFVCLRVCLRLRRGICVGVKVCVQLSMWPIAQHDWCVDAVGHV